MIYKGTILNGVVVFSDGVRPADGTPVEVRPVTAGRTVIDEAATRQGVAQPARFHELLGGWPEGQEGDGFEDVVARWRSEEPRRAEF